MEDVVRLQYPPLKPVRFRTNTCGEQGTFHVGGKIPGREIVLFRG